MKIVFLARRFSPDIGGVEKHVYEISKVLIKKGHKVTVVTQSQGDFKELDEINILRIPQSQNGWLKLHIWKWIILNRKVFKQASIIHAHDVYFWYLPLKLLFLGKKSFITFHGYESYPISKKAIFVRKLSELLATGNIIVGDFIKKWYFTKPDYVIYGGVEVSRGKQVSSIPNGKSAVFIGRLDEQTNVLEYVKAVDLIKKNYPEFKFGLVGDGKYRKRLGKYNPTGFKKDPMKYLSQYNFAFVSRYLSILEALAMKRMVFAFYDNPIKEDYLKMAPFSKFIITAKDPAELSRKVSYFLNNPKQTDKFVNLGYKWVRNQTWEKAVDTYLALWKKNY